VARILIVDDDPDLVEDCRLILENAGYQVSSAHNVPDGKVAIEKDRPDLLILDVMMDSPDDGIVMAQDLRRAGVKTPILMLTSISKVTGMTFGQDADLVPVDAFQEKPVPPKKLLSLVEELLKKGG
jgi:DNA-binding response OmpR family regulator